MEGKVWRPGPTVCRCCLSEGCYKDISTEYFWMGKKEVYADMLSDTFDLSIQYAPTGGPNSQSRLICEPCISRLRDATDFRRQIKECEQTFMEYLNPSTTVDIEIPVELPEKEHKIVSVKVEKPLSDDDDFGDTELLDDDDLDDEPLMNLASKVPKKESVDVTDLIDNAKAEKRKSTTKAKAAPKKAKVKEAKPSVSKAKPEKKKKGPRNFAKSESLEYAKELLQFSTAYPFRLQGSYLCCIYCAKVFKLPSELREHIDDCHKTIDVVNTLSNKCSGKDIFYKVDCTDLKCRLCGTGFNKVDEVARHLKYDHDRRIDLNSGNRIQVYKLTDGEYNCAICNKNLHSFISLWRHTAAHYNKYTCDTCGNRYLAFGSLKFHIRSVHSKPNCSKCHAEFDTNELLLEHNKNTKACWHFTCVTCGERFRSFKEKQTHAEKVHKKEKLMYTCAKCDITYKNHRQFYHHSIVMHSNDYFTCSFCSMKFGSKHTMRQHMATHTGEKKFECDFCHKSFTRKSNLVPHILLHSGEHYSCAICSKKFSLKRSWQKHMRSQHSKIKLASKELTKIK
ncbi:zinc finger protein 808 isoform X10 [Pieris rapae]|uniref:zinc finger protein 808 isoform X10 n=1 Tax=Pieris rapae TaxID=64459 RepID=UPI001E27B0F7|nr:zinc finger protein 808 isoform X10 [Pieris rapae]